MLQYDEWRVLPGKLKGVESVSTGCKTVSREFSSKCMEGILWIQRCLIDEDLERSASDPLHPTWDLFRIPENRGSARSQELEAAIRAFEVWCPGQLS